MAASCPLALWPCCAPSAMTKCRDLYLECLSGSTDFGVAADEKFPGGLCERVKVSDYSPRAVHALEKLTRLVVHPIHVDGGGTPCSVVFTDVWNSDLSVFREGKAKNHEIKLALKENYATGQNRAAPQNRKFEGVMCARAGVIRKTIVENISGQVFRVYDTASQSKPAHASVYMSKIGRENLTEKRARKKLWEIFGGRMTESCSAYRKGKLSMPSSIEKCG
jgi:hypothetical protein